METNTKEKIKKLLAKLYFLTSTEVDSIKSKLDVLPENALSEIFKVLKGAEKKQEDMLINLNTANPDFNKELSNFIVKHASNIKRDVEAQEQENVEKILEGI